MKHQLDSGGDAYHAGTTMTSLLQLPTNNSAPITCDADHQGVIALTSRYALCVCAYTSPTYEWRYAADNGGTCFWE